MRKRLLSFVLASVLAFGFCSPVAYAVSPADPLVASALYSFLVSAGLKLWRDGIEGSDNAVNDLIDDMKTVWGYYRDNNSNVPTWERISGSGISTNNGQIILDYDTAQTFQGFANWLATYKQMTPGNTYALNGSDSGGQTGTFYLMTMPADELQGLTALQSGVWALPVSYSTSLLVDSGRDPDAANYYYSLYSVLGGSGVCFSVEGLDGKKRIWFASTSEITVLVQNIYTNTEGINTSSTYASSRAIVRQVARPNNGSNFEFYYLNVGTISSSSIYEGPSNSILASGGDPVSEMCYVALAGDPVGTATDLFVSVGRSVFDVVRDLVDGQSLAIDVGASAGADEDDVVGVTAEGYSIPVTAEVVPSAVAYPLPIAGVQELYPQAESATDVDDLGLPALGKALTSRFPFCIPWDVVYLYQSLNATPQRPVIDIDILPQSFKQRVGIVEDTSFTFDLGDEKYAMILKIVRWSTLVGFVLGLAFATKRLVWTTGG